MNQVWDIEPESSPERTVEVLRGNAEIVSDFLGYPDLPILSSGASSVGELHNQLRSMPNVAQRMDDIIMALIHHVGHGGGIQLVVKPGQKLPPVTFIELTS